MSERKRYGFEEVKLAVNSWSWFQAQPYGLASEYYETFVANLELPDLDSESEALLQRYVANVQVNCSWYNGKLRGEKVLQGVFFALSVVLLITVPAFLYFFPVAADAAGGYGELAARLATLLAGFFAAHRTISAWLNQRKLIGPYWKARSDLGNEIYSLETEWGPKEENQKVDRNGVLDAAFRKAIEASLETARTAIQTERAQFYASYTFPDVNLTESLSSAGTAAGSLVTMFASPAVKKQRESATKREAHAATHSDLEADVAGLRAILAEFEVDLGRKQAARDAETDPDQKKKREAEVAAMVVEIAKLTTERRLKIQQRAQEAARAGLS